MNFEEVRRLTITALFSDDELFEQLVLKGGNAMALVHRISPRVSLDLDFSLEDDFRNVQQAQDRMERGLVGRFGSVGFVPFDVELVSKPMVSNESAPAWWGGYELHFKLADDALYRRLNSNREQLRREALVIGPKQQKKFTVDFSKCEYTLDKVKVQLDDFTVYVYPPQMIALEKVRAICQQMDEYRPTARTKRPRARDFFDIYTIVEKTGFHCAGSEELLKNIFGAKEVPLALIGKIRQYREYHRNDWPNVRASVAGKLQEFDFYFEFVLNELDPLHALWME